MTKKPQDLLEFLRRSSDDPEGDQAPSTAPRRPREDSTPRMLVLRRSQVAVALASAGLFVLLAFVLGLAFAGGPAAEPAAVVKTKVWVIRAISFDDSRGGRSSAKMVVQQLEERNLDEVNLQKIESDGKVVVTVGSWLRNPRGIDTAGKLLERVRNLRDVDQKRPFHDAQFWQIER